MKHYIITIVLVLLSTAGTFAACNWTKLENPLVLRSDYDKLQSEVEYLELEISRLTRVQQNLEFHVTRQSLTLKALDFALQDLEIIINPNIHRKDFYEQRFNEQSIDPRIKRDGSI